MMTRTIIAPRSQHSSGSRESGVGSRESGAGSRESGVGSRESGVGGQRSGEMVRGSGFRVQGSGFRSRKSEIACNSDLYRVLGTEYWILSTLYDSATNTQSTHPLTTRSPSHSHTLTPSHPNTGEQR